MRYQEVISDEHTERIGLLCRVINFLEDIVDDAECRDIYVNGIELDKGMVVLEPIRCEYNISESIGIFRDQYDLVVSRGIGDIALRELYEHVINYYARTLHEKMQEYALKTDTTGKEYYLGVLFDGRGFIIEGEENKVAVPGNIQQCLSAHTHPSSNPIPSRNDIRVINEVFVNRGIGHVIETSGLSLVIYRAGPISLNDYEVLKQIERSGDIQRVIYELMSRTMVKARYI